MQKRERAWRLSAVQVLGTCCVLCSWGTSPLHGQHLDSADVRITLDSALRVAHSAAALAFPELPRFLLYSISPRVFKGDPGGLHWQVRWQELAFPHHRWLVVRVYMSDGRTSAERLDDGGGNPADTAAGHPASSASSQGGRRAAPAGPMDRSRLQPQRP